MKYLKTFESYSINEEEEFFDKIGDFFRGGTAEEISQKKEDYDKEIADLLKSIEEIDASKRKEGVKTIIKMREYGDNEYYAFDKAKMDKIAKDNNYLGKLSSVWSTKSFDENKIPTSIFITWKDGEKGMNKLAAGTSQQTVGK